MSYSSNHKQSVVVLLQLQEMGVGSVYKGTLLLLALYREVTLANACSQRQNISDEVSWLFILQAGTSGCQSGDKLKVNKFHLIRFFVIC